MCGAVVNRFVFHKMKLEFQRNNAWHVFVRLQQIEKLIYVSQRKDLFSLVKPTSWNPTQYENIILLLSINY